METYDYGLKHWRGYEEGVQCIAVVWPTETLLGHNIEQSQMDQREEYRYEQLNLFRSVNRVQTVGVIFVEVHLGGQHNMNHILKDKSCE